jgi:hypothetical protein
MSNFMFPVFDWLHARGLLSTEGTVWDYTVLSVLALILAVPVAVIGWALS